MIHDLEGRLQVAVQSFWDARDRQQQKQLEGGTVDTGSRGAVTGGTQMGALELLITDILVDAGLTEFDVKTRTGLELPGYYRPEKMWDLIVVTGSPRRLVMAGELKSQVGPSFGNNYNNRTEEAIGNAEDMWTAYRQGRFGKWPPPFLGYLMLLEDCEAVHRPVQAAEPYFEVDPIFKQSGEYASYAKRYEILCERLMLERKYNATCLLLATRETPTRINSPPGSVDFATFAAAIDAHALLLAATL
jgi:hypothetical protein